MWGAEHYLCKDLVGGGGGHYLCKVLVLSLFPSTLGVICIMVSPLIVFTVKGGRRGDGKSCSSF